MPCHKIMTQFGCRTHFEILLEAPHPDADIFSSNLDELENWSWPMRWLPLMLPKMLGHAQTVVQSQTVVLCVLRYLDESEKWGGEGGASLQSPHDAATVKHA